jgi:hypothetical protein
VGETAGFVFAYGSYVVDIGVVVGGFDGVVVDERTVGREAHEQNTHDTTNSTSARPLACVPKGVMIGVPRSGRIDLRCR